MKNFFNTDWNRKLIREKKEEGLTRADVNKDVYDSLKEAIKKEKEKCLI